jgi:group I intron endonuclease
MIGIYKISSPTNRIYIGQSKNLETRFKYYEKCNCKRQIKLYNSFKKHGVKNHKFEIIEECSLEMLDEREVYWGTIFNVLEGGLNHKIGNGVGTLSQETKDKISKSLTGKKKTPEHCLNLSLSKKGTPSKRKGIQDLKQRGKSKPGAGGKGKPKNGAGPKTGNSIKDTLTGKIYLSIKNAIDDTKISKRKIFLMLKIKDRFVYLNKNYYKNK